VSRLALLATVAAITAVVFAVVTAGGSAQQPGEQTLVLKEINKGGAFGYVDNPPKARGGNPENPRVSAGDLFTFSTFLHNAQKHRVGRIEGTCIAVRPGRTFAHARFDCHAVVTLKNGTLTISANVKFRRSFVKGSIDGGTGAYRQARGWFTSKGDPSTDRFHVLP
jgi:hypothetical protein